MIFSIVGALRRHHKSEREGAETESLDFTTVYHANFAFVWRTVRALGVPESAVPDATQEVFVVILRRLSDYQPTASLRSWVFGIARRVAKDFRRSNQRRGVVVPLNDDLSASGTADPHDAARRNEALRWVEEFADTLDEERRALFVLSELEELSMAEIAEALGTNQNTLYSRLKIVKTEFSRYLAKRAGHGEDMFP